jgi:glycosyltransferase involved in cell wall biosynthesis
MTPRDVVLITFSDSSLGGTSRSALSMGGAWRLAGYSVVFLALRGPHPTRLSSFESVGSVVTDAGGVPWGRVRLVHFHHGVWNPALLRDFCALRDAAAACDPPPPLLTHNIFGEPEGALASWPAALAVGLLGQWLEFQYVGRAPIRAKLTRRYVVPNPQDLDYFRAPSTEERREARADLGFRGERVLLRVGSPHRNKWSPSYLSLARRLGAGDLLVVVGAPRELSVDLEQHPRVLVLPGISDEGRLRSVYWAADVFVLDARQGESFGNVCLEAVGCGLPLVYRGRPYRDNTPWEFQRLGNVVIASSERAWVTAALSTGPGRHSERSRVSEQYGVAAVARLLAQIADDLAGGDASSSSGGMKSTGGNVSPAPDWPALRYSDCARMLLRHNPLFYSATRVKRRVWDRSRLPVVRRRR